MKFIGISSRSALGSAAELVRAMHRKAARRRTLFILGRWWLERVWNETVRAGDGFQAVPRLQSRGTSSRVENSFYAFIHGAKASGTLASNFIGAPVMGWVNSNFQACSMRRGTFTGWRCGWA